jgi:oxygen-independent coproporphyrinogen-3 oxidase
MTLPLSLYIHLPWCVQKCPYCDFNSHRITEPIPEQAYSQQLLAELQTHLPLVWGRTVQTVFIGGGTPSLFSVEAMDAVLSQLRAHLFIQAGAEITLEANPNSADQAKFAGFKQAGVNRLSLGIQSFADDKLRALGRAHDNQQAIAAIEMAQAVGFDSFNLDLMFALPQQSVAQALADLRKALEFQPPHLSWYQLTLEPNTLFYQQPPALPDEDLAWEIQSAGQALLGQSGYQAYEISAYARQPALRCRHNLNYWQFGDYLALGAGAHGKITTAEGQVLRYQNPRSPQAYLLKYRVDYQAVASQDLPLEFMLNALRLTDGVPLAWFAQRTGLKPAQIQTSLLQAQAKGWLKPSQSQLCPTAQGLQFLNELLLLFLPDQV